MLFDRIFTYASEEGTTLNKPSVHSWPCSTLSIMALLAIRPIRSGYCVISHRPAPADKTNSNAIHSTVGRSALIAAGIFRRNSARQPERVWRDERSIAA